MIDSANPLAAWSAAAAGAAYTAFALYLWRVGYLRPDARSASRLLVAAAAATAAWGWLGVADTFTTKVLFLRLGGFADVLAYGFWFAFLVSLLRPAAGGTSRMRSEERRVGKECRSRWSP